MFKIMKKATIFVCVFVSLLLCSCNKKDDPKPNDDTPVIDSEDALKGMFSVSDNKKVQFSRGNLQYVGTWQFASNQWDYFGASQTDNHRDVFGWGTGNMPNKVSKDGNDYIEFTDWGINAITNGGNKPNLWRTLAQDEWQYLFFGRTNASSYFGLGCVNGVNGIILLPDNWVLPSGITFTASTIQGLENQGTYYYNKDGNNFSHNTYTIEQWSKLEEAGAIFLPTAGERWGTSVDGVGSDGLYWASTPRGAGFAYSILFRSYDLYPQFNGTRESGMSVRLVR